MTLRIEAIVVTALLAAAPVALAQRAFGPGPSDRARQSVYVRDSAVAGEKLALAERMERLKEWDKSADVYQEIVQKYADRVVPTATAENGITTRYSSVVLEVQRRLGKWNDDGLRVYRGRYEAPAAALLESAGSDDVAALNRVIQLYFATDAAKTAALRLMELYIENGEFSAAAWIGQRLLDNHPGLGADVAKVIFRTALALHLAGDEEAARAKLDDLKKNHAGAVGRVRGRDVVLADELGKMLASPPPVARGGADADSWPIFGGDASRGRVPNANGQPGAKVAEIPVVRSRALPMPADRRRATDDADKRSRELGLGLGIMPSVDRGELFYQDNKRVYAASVDSGLPLPGWAITYGTGARQRFASKNEALEATGNLQMTVTVSDNAVLAVLGQPAPRTLDEAAGVVVSTHESHLDCLDRTSGAVKWSIWPRQFPESQKDLRTLDLSGSPLVVGDNVYVCARGGKPMQFEDAYVLCFNLADGKLRWSCYLASGNAPGDNFNGIPPVLSDVVSHLAYAGGRVYACTNLGAVAAVDAYAGTIAWLSVYPKQPATPNYMGGFQGQGVQVNLPGSRKPWAQNPVIVRDGKVFALPTDSDNLFILDAGSGEQIKRIPTAEFDDADTLLGVLRDKLLIASLSQVFCVNWSIYDAQKPDNNRAWYARISPPTGDPNVTDKDDKDTIRGRAFVTHESVFVPTRWNIRRLQMSDGRVVEVYPKNGAWPSGQGPGNVLVTQDQVIVAGSDSIDIYSDLSLARAKLDQQIAAAPNDPTPRLKYAETLFAAGQFDPAVQKLDEAIGLLGGMNAMRPGAERDRAFSRALTFAERFVDPKAGASDPSRAAAMYDRAGAAAYSPAQQVAYRLSRARFSRNQHDFASEVRLYQEILSSPQYRGVNVPAEDGSGMTLASLIAESSIRERLKSDPSAYQPFEQAATEAFAKAKQANDPAQMLAVAQTYPNARVAPQAMLAAADAYEATGQLRPATQVLNQLYRKYRDVIDKPRVIEAMAHCYLALPGGVEVAIGRLNEGVKALQGTAQIARPLRLPDGSTIEDVSFGAAVELLQKYAARLEQASLPDFRLPRQEPGHKPKPFLPETPETIIRDVDALVLPPPHELRALTRNDRVVTWSKSTGIAIYPVGAGEPAARAESAKFASKPFGVWVGDDLVAWNGEKVALIRGDNGLIVWQQEVKSLAPADMPQNDVEIARVTDGDDAPAAAGGPQVIVGPGAAILDNQQVQFARRQRLQLLLAQQQQQQMRAAAGGGDGAAEHIAHLRPVGDRIVVGTTTGRIAAFELNNGKIAWQTRVGDSALLQMVASDDFVAARFNDDYGMQIVALDAFNGLPVMRRGYASTDGQLPLNMALAADGTLVWTLPDRLCAKDLFDSGKALKFGDGPAGNAGNAIFTGMALPEQLIIASGRIFALSDGGRMVREYSTESGLVPDSDKNLPTTDASTYLRTVGTQMYVISLHQVLPVNIDPLKKNPPTWSPPPSSYRPPWLVDAFIGKMHFVALDQPGGNANQPPPRAASTHYRLLAYGRYRGGESESFKMDQDPDIVVPAGIDQWQGVEGGFYYHAGDRTARFLKGAGPAASDAATKPTTAASK